MMLYIQLFAAILAFFVTVWAVQSGLYITAAAFGLCCVGLLFLVYKETE